MGTRQQRVANALVKNGPTRTAEKLGLSVEATLRLAIPGLRVHRGTEALADQRLHLLESDPPPAMTGND